jgi:hypothetical protein
VRALVMGMTTMLGVVALGVGGFVAHWASSRGCDTPQPARTPVLLVESDVRGGVHGILP